MFCDMFHNVLYQNLHFVYFSENILYVIIAWCILLLAMASNNSFLVTNFVQVLIFGWKNSMLELSVQIDALCYSLNGPILMFSLIIPWNSLFWSSSMMEDMCFGISFCKFILGKVGVFALNDLWSFLEKW